MYARQRIILPAFEHELVDVRRASLWSGQALSVMQDRHYDVKLTQGRRCAKTVHLPQGDAVTPHVTLTTEPTVTQGLGGTPTTTHMSNTHTVTYMSNTPTKTHMSNTLTVTHMSNTSKTTHTVQPPCTSNTPKTTHTSNTPTTHV